MPCQRQFHDHESSVFRVFLPVFNLALGLFREKGNVLLRILMSLDRKEEVIKYARCKFLWQKKFFHVIITSTLLFYPLRFAYVLEKIFKFFGFFKNFFLYLLFHQMKQFCFANLLGIPQ